VASVQARMSRAYGMLGRIEDQVALLVENLKLYEQVWTSFHQTPDRLANVRRAHQDLRDAYASADVIPEAIRHAQSAYDLAKQLVERFGSDPARDFDIQYLEEDLQSLQRGEAMSALRLIVVSKDVLLSGDFSSCEKEFDNLERQPNLNRLWWSYFLACPCFDDDPRDNYLIPQVRGLIQALYASRPHLLYFFDLDPRLHALDSHLKALLGEEFLDMSDDGRFANYKLSVDEYASFAARYLKPAIEFAERAGISRQECYGRYSLLFGPDIWSLVLNHLSDKVDQG
jgi:hypothetical protein